MGLSGYRNDMIDGRILAACQAKGKGQRAKDRDHAIPIRCSVLYPAAVVCHRVQPVDPSPPSVCASSGVWRRQGRIRSILTVGLQQVSNGQDT
ncbi:hypothetical protein K431DRAFT_282739 [Polychaeton citri CBS 116435]|uniref:Uncharacterized protein n=1 Tax=Polychaeton citri CBS 116435 TaxID=1314669 RepID=A0A9P4UR80_9PEZI|nr:hypothetical protein K431DRAFT_282739 [Polychaeton citri CBS 116435]